MPFWKFVFFLSAFIIFFNYIGYALIVYLLNKIRPKYKNSFANDFYPSVSFIVAAYNEQDIIEEKIKNSLKQSYPASKIEFIIITDGSSDNTPLIVKKFKTVTLLHNVERKGKSAALNRAVSFANNDILIMSDANTFLNTDAVKNIARIYSDELVGGVSGEKKVMPPENDIDNVGGREGLYWKYESFLKKIDSEFYSVVGAAGELFSVRKKLYENIPEATILDDFVISLKVALKGFRIIYEPRAYAMEFSSISINDEKKRKIRIAAGGFQAIKMLPGLFKFWKFPRLTFLYISHRVLRWALSPLCLLIMLVSNILIVFKGGGLFYQVLLVLQIAFYLISLVSVFLSSDSKMKILKFAGYFVFMNISVYQGFFRFILNRQTATWEKVNRPSAKINL